MSTKLNCFLNEKDQIQDINFNEEESKNNIKNKRNEIKNNTSVLKFYLRQTYILLEYKVENEEVEEITEPILKDFMALFNTHYELSIKLIKELKELIQNDERYSIELPEATEVIIKSLEHDYFKDYKLYYKFYKQQLFNKNDYYLNTFEFFKSLKEYDIFSKILEMYEN